MPEFRVSQISIVNQIRSNLQDRYESGFPILKELLQNADDSGARRIRIDALPGWPTASNLLLQGPGLLVANDGVFCKEDERGITSFGESSKAADNTVIGKFGFGQKAVFHLCDAFIVYAYGGKQCFSTVVNPFLGVKIDGNISQNWEPPSDDGLETTDLQLLSNSASSDFSDRCLTLWLPMRRKDLRPAPGVGFSSNFPSSSMTIAELAKSSDLRVLLTALRHLESIEIRENGTIRCAIEVKESRGRLLGPDKWLDGIRQFDGAIKSNSDQMACKFVAREVTASDGRLVQLQRTSHWPTTIDVRNLEPQPEKGQPHGAATFLRDSACSVSQLQISWAVFLPISEDSDITICLGSTTLGECRLLLHGYFFLDSGRRRIENLDAPAEHGEPSDASALRRAWNAGLRDSVVLPLLPALLWDAFNSKMVTSAELAQLVAAVAGNEWFQRNRSAICKESALVRVLEASRRNIWRLVPSGSTLRPLPKSVADALGRIEELFPDIHSWAQNRKTLLFLDKSASLTAKPMRWAADDLDSLFTVLSPKAFQSRALSPLLADFLASIDLEEANRRTVGPHLVSALRKAMTETQALASSELVKSILSHVPAGVLFQLPASVESRQVLRVLASTPTTILPVRNEWLDESHLSSQLSNADLKALLNALEPLIGGDHADQTAIVALALLTRAKRNISELAYDPEFTSIKVLRARDIHSGGPVALSLQTLVERSQQGLLFAPSPQANSLLPLLAHALPDAAPLVVERKTAKFLQDSSNFIVRLHGTGSESILKLVNEASRFGTTDARRKLLERLRPTNNDDRAALRRLCVGDDKAGNAGAALHVLEGALKGIERTVEVILNSNANAFLVPVEIANEITPKLRVHIGIATLDTPRLGRLLERDVNVITNIQLTPIEREAFLLTDLPDSLLRRLPIHVRSDRTMGSAENVFREGDWPIPETLKPYVLTIRPCSNRQARERQERLIEAWSPRSQIEIALACTDPHRFRGEILDVLAMLGFPPDEDLCEQLRARPWLLADQQPLGPKDVLALPSNVDEAARALLLKSGEMPPFLPVAKLTIEVRTHRGFANLEKWILPDRRSSFAALALMIEDERIIGRLGEANNDYPIDAFATLANGGACLGLPGWPLLAAVLTSLGDGRDDAAMIVAAFAGLDASNAKLAGTCLDNLAALAEERGQKGEAARRAYRHGFGIVAVWPEDVRCQVFGRTRVLTEAGSWHSGREVVQGGDGLDPRHVLARDYASMLGKYEEISDAEGVPPDPFAANRHRGEIRDVDLVALEAQSAEQQRSFLDTWKGRVPSDLVIVYLGLICRSKIFKRLANDWATDATTDVDTLWNDLDKHFPTEILYPGPLAAEVDQRRFLVEQVAGERVQTTAMSGDSFDAPLDGTGRGILIGNLHKTYEGIYDADGKVRSLITLPVRQVDLSGYSQKKASKIFRRFVEAIAADCLLLRMERQRTALQEMLDKAVEVDQSTIEETERQLRDRLPDILAELKLPTECHAQKALREYQVKESRLHHLSASAQKMDDLKAELWRKVSDNALTVELLSAVRSKIGDFGYSASRVLFELFQNADDAYRQYGEAAEDARFRVELFSDNSGGFRVVHWGRPINHRGSGAEEGRRLGHDRDLLNMLRMNFSEKRPGDDLTGKFGLGFKSVHVLSDSVGIVSGFIALRTVGGFLPAAWPEGIGVGEDRKNHKGRKATVIDVPFSTETAARGIEAVTAFKVAVTWLPAFACAIQRVEIEGDAPVNVNCDFFPLLAESTIDAVSISSPNMERALRIDLSDGYRLLLRIEAAGPCAFPANLKRLWNLAPLEKDLRSGWLLNGPFDVDPGRTGLAGSITDQQEKFQKLGRVLGDRLLELHDLVGTDWSLFAKGLDLDTSEEMARNIFWCRLFCVLEPDFDDYLARHLHLDGHGYGRLAGQRQVVPTRLPPPFNSLVRASEVDYYTDGALSDRATLDKVRDWPTLAKLQNRVIASEVAGQLKKLGFGNARPLRFSSILRRQIGEEKRIDPELAETIGHTITPQSIRETPLDNELREILDISRRTLFLDQEGAWRVAQLPHSDAADNDEDRRLCEFAPATHLLDKRYTGPALEFFRVARERSGFGAQARDLALWAGGISTEDHARQAAILRYIIEGRQGRALAEVMRDDLPSWVPQPLEILLTDALLAEWTDEDKKRLLLEFGGHNLFNLVEGAPPPPAPLECEAVLLTIYEWWLARSANLRTLYARRTYPESFSPLQLRETGDRAAWFTMFALACFQSFGRTQDEQHRAFIEQGQREAWWHEIAVSRPPTDIQSWLDRLERWSATEEFDQEFLPWRRTFVDLYTIARWLDEYIEIFQKLPRIIGEQGVISLNDILRPSYSPSIMPLGLDAAPLIRSIGIGANWMIRELIRFDVYASCDEGLVAPYCWAPSRRVRDLLNKLDADVGEEADKEASRAIYNFVTDHLGSDRARFDGDFDLPLQLITREENRAALDQCFETARLDLPTSWEREQDAEEVLRTGADNG